MQGTADQQRESGCCNEPLPAGETSSSQHADRLHLINIDDCRSPAQSCPWSTSTANHPDATAGAGPFQRHRKTEARLD
jgi:hypothetical protein